MPHPQPFGATPLSTRK